MKRVRRAVAAVMVAGVCLFAANASVAQAAPSLVLDPSCSKHSTGETVYAVNISLTGLAPNASFIAQLDFTYINPPPGQVGGSFGPATFSADANGNFTLGPIGTVGIKTIFTATVIYQGQTLKQTLAVTCEPTTNGDCQNGGWRDFPGFKNQGDCVSFVATKGKSQPSGP